MELSKNLQALRKRNGFSQEELAERLSISRQAVSKWESGQSYPDLDNLVELARIYGVSVDSMLGRDLEDAEPVSAETPDGSTYEDSQTREDWTETERGYLRREPGHFEYRSKRAWGKLPLVHVNMGWNMLRLRTGGGLYRTKTPRAKGVIAVGNVACGLLSVGFVSMGLLSIGLVTLGLLAIGMVAAGLAAVGLIAGGLLAVGGVALGLLAVGGITTGLVSVGGIAAGAYAQGGIAAGTHVAIGYYADAPVAIGVHVTGEYTLVGESLSQISASEARELILRHEPNIAKWLLEALLQTFKIR